jgi:hypothetical protein
LKQINRILVGLAVLFVLGFLANVCDDYRRGRWEDRAERAEQSARVQQERADYFRLRFQADSARADSLAENARERGRQVKSRVAAVRAVVAPDTCAPFVAQRDSIIDEQDSVIGTWERAYDASLRAIGDLKLSNEALQVRGDTLAAALSARPKPRSRLIPSPGAGVFTGLCRDLEGNVEPCYGAGVTLSWKF